MSLDLTLLQLLKERPRYERLARSVPARALDPTSKLLLDAFGAYFKDMPNALTVEVGPFMAWAKLSRFKKSTDEALAKLAAIMQRVQAGCDPALESGMLLRLAEAAMAADALAAVAQFNDGEEINLAVRMAEIKEEFEGFAGKVEAEACLADTIEDQLAETENDSGIHWRLNCLNRSMRPLRSGDFGIVAARPDKGKGTFITSEATFWAPQVLKEFGPDRPILIMTNEGPGKRIFPRLYSAALNKTAEELIPLSNKGVLRQMYAEATGGANIIKVVEIHDRWSHDVERIIKQQRPSIVVFDMIDNIKWSGGSANNGQRTDQLLEAMYAGCRNWCVKYDFIGIATSQLSADAHGVLYPADTMLKDSKTGKQGACEFIITIGTSADPTLGGSRFIGCVKNKLRRTGAPQSPNSEVIFDGERALYADAPQ